MDILELAKRVERLEDIEAIKKLQGKYYRCLDTKEWDELGTCFAPEFTTSFTDGKYVFDNWADLRKFYDDNMGVGKQLSQHNGHTPEITVNDDGTAHAYWYLHDYLIIPPADWGVRGTAIYEINYKKCEDGWKISQIGYKRVFEEGWAKQKPEKIRVNINRFANK